MSVVFALATPPAKSAICVFRVSGDGCHQSLKKLFNKKSFSFNRFYVEPFSFEGRLVDRVGLVVFKGPKSYTGEDSFEVYAHGSLGVMSDVVSAFKGVGFDEAVGGEFTKRAFLNNKITLNEAEAVSDLVDSTDSRGVVLSNNNLFGALSSSVVSFGDEIDSVRVKVEAEIDFSDEGNDYYDESLVAELKGLYERFDLFVGACVSKKNNDEKNNIVLVGPVNSGKSSVFNRLLGYERAIVSDVPGTTRDMIGSEIFYETNSFKIFDTAGFREAPGVLEKKGIDISMSEINNSDLILGVFEKSNMESFNFFNDLCSGKNYICVQNKIDLDDCDDVVFDCCVSAKTGEGFGRLKSLVEDCFNGGVKESDYKFLIKERQEKLFYSVLSSLKSAIEGLSGSTDIFLELVAEDLKDARSCLDEVVGIKYSDSLLGEVFNSFCIGK